MKPSFLSMEFPLDPASSYRNLASQCSLKSLQPLFKEFMETIVLFYFIVKTI